MPTPYEIPLIPQAQTLSISLNAVTYNLSIQWNVPSQSWKLDITDVNDVPLLTGIPLVTGVDLLSPYPYMNFGGQLIAQTDHNPLAPPTYDNLGVTGHLYWVTQ